jgi:hypothetical protein
MLHLQLIYNIIFKIKSELYIAQGQPPPPPEGKILGASLKSNMLVLNLFIYIKWTEDVQYKLEFQKIVQLVQMHSSMRDTM